MSNNGNKNKNGNSCCSSSSHFGLTQTLDEMQFDRGIWPSAIHGDLQRVQRFLAKGTHVDIADKSGYTALVNN